MTKMIQAEARAFARVVERLRTERDEATAYAGRLAEALGSLQEMLAKQLMGDPDGVTCAACGKRGATEMHEDGCPVDRGLVIIDAALAKNPSTESPATETGTVRASQSYDPLLGGDHGAGRDGAGPMRETPSKPAGDSTLNEVLTGARLDVLVDRFLAWPVPASVYPDGTPGLPGRTGTNLLSATEARSMLEYVLAAAPEPPRGEMPCEKCVTPMTCEHRKVCRVQEGIEAGWHNAEHAKLDKAPQMSDAQAERERIANFQAAMDEEIDP